MVGLINSVFLYLTIGFILMALFDLLTVRLKEEDSEYAELGDFTFKERIIVIVLWPYSLYVFIKRFIEGQDN